MEKLESHKEQSPFEKIADKLDSLQKDKNEGRGVSCVRTVVLYLRRGEIESAKAVCWNEADKIVGYPDIRKFIQQELFARGTDKDIPPHFRPENDELYSREL